VDIKAGSSVTEWSFVGKESVPLAYMAAVVVVVQIRIVQSFISKECLSQTYSTVVAQGISYHNGSSKVLKLGSTGCGRGMEFAFPSQQDKPFLRSFYVIMWPRRRLFSVSL
jgi:hypothetical protein